MSTLDVNTIATDANISDLVGASELANIMPDGWADAEPARQIAYDNALKTLSRRTPPVYEATLSIPAELRDATVYGALANLYARGITGTDDPQSIQWKRFRDEFNAELRSIRPTVEDGVRAPNTQISLERR